MVSLCENEWEATIYVVVSKHGKQFRNHRFYNSSVSIFGKPDFLSIELGADC